jgi:hypothetical protein
MAENAQIINQESGEISLKRYGKILYETNPSVAGSFPIRMKPKTTKTSTDVFMVAPGTGEVVTRGSFAFVEDIEVDEAQFVKIYLDGIKQYGQLSKAGAVLFELIYKEMSGKGGKDKDTVIINFILASRWKPDLTRRTFERGMNEILEKGFLFRSVAADVYFVNIRFMFNGNRQTVIKSYRIKGRKQDVEQRDLFASLEEPSQMETLDNES